MNPFGCLRLNDFILFTCLQQKFAGLKITSICRFAIFKTFAAAKIPDFFSKNTLMGKNQKKQPHSKKFPNSKTVSKGRKKDIVILGEAPANNGWRKSGMLWRDTTGKMLPSGVVLQRLFDIIDRKVLDTSFLEGRYSNNRSNVLYRRCPVWQER